MRLLGADALRNEPSVIRFLPGSALMPKQAWAVNSLTRSKKKRFM
jgi:hypothetical protein